MAHRVSCTLSLFCKGAFANEINVVSDSVETNGKRTGSRDGRGEENLTRDKAG